MTAPHCDDHTPMEQARLNWDDRGQPLSIRFDDVYFSREDGLAETDHVFIDGNGLRERWPGLSSDGGTFTIGETGFGTGLNFLLAAQLWLQLAPDNWQLHFLSAEKHPLSHDDFRRSLALWPELAGTDDEAADVGAELAAQWPLPLSGCHRRTFAQGRIRLTLLYGDATSEFTRLVDASQSSRRGDQTGVDAWFLDGFAPARNEDMWTSELYRSIARLSRPGATVATFTAAGHVRRGLIDAGFTMRRVAGYGTKREMLSGSIEQPPAADRPWRQTPWFVPGRPPDISERKAVVIGAGIAGCSTAAALAQRGWRVTLVDRHDQPGAEASGNPQGILYPRLSHDNGLLPRFALQALLHACAWYAPYWASQYDGQRCGVLLLPERHDRQQPSLEFARLVARYTDSGLVKKLDGDQVSEAAGITLAAREALFLPHSGWVAPPQVCQWLASQPGIHFHQADIDHLEQDARGRWHLWSHGQQSLSSPIVVLANAAAVGRFSQTDHLPLRVIRGQVSAVTDAPELSPLRTVLCGKGYLAPATQRAGSPESPSHRIQTLGATYDLDDTDLKPRQIDHQRNLDTLASTDAALRQPLERSDPESWHARVSLRCTAPDYLPLIGPAPDCDQFIECYAGLRRDARRTIAVAGPNQTGLFVHCALGSRGLTYAPLGADYLADLIEGQLPALSPALQQAIHPARFLVRDLRKNRI